LPAFAEGFFISDLIDSFENPNVKGSTFARPIKKMMANYAQFLANEKTNDASVASQGQQEQSHKQIPVAVAVNTLPSELSMQEATILSTFSIAMSFDKETKTSVELNIVQLIPELQAVIDSPLYRGKKVLDPYDVLPKKGKPSKQNKLLEDISAILRYYSAYKEDAPAPSKTAVIRVSHTVFGLPRKEDQSSLDLTSALEAMVSGVASRNMVDTNIARCAILAALVPIQHAISFFEEASRRPATTCLLSPAESVQDVSVFQIGWPVTMKYLETNFLIELSEAELKVQEAKKSGKKKQKTKE